MDTYRVQVPAARGKVMPEIDSISEDFPALWAPITAICGRSMSVWTLLSKNAGHTICE